MNTFTVIKYVFLILTYLPLQTGYPVHQLIVDAQNRIVAVQRVISPDVDSTVSQSANSMQLTQRQVSETARSEPRSMLVQPVSCPVCVNVLKL